MPCLQVYASGTGNRRDPLYFLQWLRRSKQQQPGKAAHGYTDSNAGATAAGLPVSYPATYSKGNGFQAVFGRSSPVRVLPIVLHTLGYGSAKAFKVSTAQPQLGAQAHGEGPMVEPPDVAEERLRTYAVTDYEDNPVVIRSLHKVYPAQDCQLPKVCLGVCLLAKHRWLEHGKRYDCYRSTFLFMHACPYV